MTNPNGLVLDVFQFTDSERFLALNAGAQRPMLRALKDVVAGRIDAAERLRGARQSLFHRRDVAGQARRPLRQPRRRAGTPIVEIVRRRRARPAVSHQPGDFATRAAAWIWC